MPKCKNIATIFRREFTSYFNAPVAYVFLVAFLMLTGFLTFMVAQYYERRIADLSVFFQWHPWVYLLLVPAATMGLWAEERRNGTIELLLTMPLTLTEILLGKFFAAWLFIAIALGLTFPVVVTTGWLGAPDYGVIACGYAGSLLLAGACVSVGMFASALTRSQVVSFVVALSLCLVLNLAGFPPVMNVFAGWAPAWLLESVAACSFLQHFESLCRGVLDAYDVAYYAAVMVFMLAAAHVVVEHRKGS
jgi:ABC-2 type transport system permease protein